MFKFLKEKLGKAVSRFTKKVKEETKEEVVEKPVKKKGILRKIKEKIVTKRISEGEFENIFFDLEVVLLENNVAVEVIEKIKGDLKKKLLERNIKRGDVEKVIKESLKNSLEDLFKVEEIDLLKEVKKKKPFVIVFVGINGSGKTTTIAKIAKFFLDNKLTCVLAAADTFRAASIEQLQEHADKLRIKMIKHDYGADPAAVAFDAVKHAEAKKIDVVLVDTAGRMHSNVNLTDEMKKIIRVVKPDLKIFVGESITGNDCIEQVKVFDEAIKVDGIILAKADVDEKGGTAISISYVSKKPIIFLGTGQKYNDLEKFDKEKIVESLGF